MVGLDWVFTHDAFKFCTSHVHAFFMHTLYLFFPFMVCDVFYSLSLSQIDRANNTNPLRLGSLFVVPSHPLSILIFHLIFGSVMRRPRWTSLRTFRTVVFIRNARSSYRISLTLLYPKSFRLRDGSPSVGDRRGVWSCSFRSFTPTCTTSIPLCLVLLPHSEVHVS